MYITSLVTLLFTFCESGPVEDSRPILYTDTIWHTLCTLCGWWGTT